MQESIVFSGACKCCRKESSRSLSHLLMSFLLYIAYSFYERSNTWRILSGPWFRVFSVPVQLIYDCLSRLVSQVVWSIVSSSTMISLVQKTNINRMCICNRNSNKNYSVVECRTHCRIGGKTGGAVQLISVTSLCTSLYKRSWAGHLMPHVAPPPPPTPH